jgi:hypothetical protein
LPEGHKFCKNLFCVAAAPQASNIAVDTATNIVAPGARSVFMGAWRAFLLYVRAATAEGARQTRAVKMPSVLSYPNPTLHIAANPPRIEDASAPSMVQMAVAMAQAVNDGVASAGGDLQNMLAAAASLTSQSDAISAEQRGELEGMSALIAGSVVRPLLASLQLNPATSEETQGFPPRIVGLDTAPAIVPVPDGLELTALLEKDAPTLTVEQAAERFETTVAALVPWTTGASQTVEGAMQDWLQRQETVALWHSRIADALRAALQMFLEYTRDDLVRTFQRAKDNVADSHWAHRAPALAEALQKLDPESLNLKVEFTRWESEAVHPEPAAEKPKRRRVHGDPLDADGPELVSE